ncbi:RNA polymerase sigma factor [Singulisphaera acidiphila]|nr:RNA polymerase sigma factor [Singulisphaera acidiphila]
MDSAQLGRLIDRLAGPLELYARQWCDTPEDVVQEAFMKLASQRKPLLSLDAWLFRTVRNGAINAKIASYRRKRHEAEAAAKGPAWFEADPLALGRRATAVDPELAQSALAALPIAQREVIVAHLWGALSFEQIADLAGTSASSAHRLYHAGLTALRERLGIPCRTTSTTRSIPG